MTEFLIVLCTLWALGIVFFIFSFGEIMKDDPHVADMLRMSAESNPLGLVLLSAAIVCWPFTLLLRVMNKQ
jgi:hypothetical protein